MDQRIRDYSSSSSQHVGAVPSSRRDTQSQLASSSYTPAATGSSFRSSSLTTEPALVGSGGISSSYSQRLDDLMFKYRELEIAERKCNDELDQLRRQTSYTAMDRRRELEYHLKQIYENKLPIKTEINDLKYIVGQSSRMPAPSRQTNNNAARHRAAGSPLPPPSSSSSLRSSSMRGQNPTRASQVSRASSNTSHQPRTGSLPTHQRVQPASIDRRLVLKPITERIETKSVMARLERKPVAQRLVVQPKAKTAARPAAKKTPLKPAAARHSNTKTSAAAPARKKGLGATLASATDLDRDLDLFMAPRKLGDHIVTWSDGSK